MKGHMSFLEFSEKFPAEGAARRFYEKLRWPVERYCPHCGTVGKSKPVPKSKPMPYWCKSCRKYFSVRTGAVFEKSKLPLRTWLLATYLITTARKGISSVQLAKELGITQKNAWHLGHRIREAYLDPGEPMGPGEIEIDEAFFGGKEMNKHSSKKLKQGRGAVGKQSVMGIKDWESGKVRAIPVTGTDKDTTSASIIKNVQIGSKLYTDKAAGYRGLPYEHEAVGHTVGEYVRGKVHVNGVESFWALLKRGHYGIYHQMSVKHLHRYLTEFSGRHNMKGDTLRCLEQIARGMFGKRLPYRELIGANLQGDFQER